RSERGGREPQKTQAVFTNTCLDTAMSDSVPTPEQPITPPSQPTAAPPAALSPENQRLWATLVHIGWLAGSFFGLPFVPAIVGYLVLKDRGGFIRQHTAAAFNFQISWLIWG